MKNLYQILILGWGWLLLAACTPFSQAPATFTPPSDSVILTEVIAVTVPVVTVAPTETATATPFVTIAPPTPENCNTGWSWATGPDEPEFAQVVQKMMATAQISGTVRVSTYGENDGCGRYHAMSTDFTFTIPVPDPTNEAALAPQAEALLQLAQTANQDETRPAPNFGNLEIAFTNDSQRCYWRHSGAEWNIRCEGNE